MSSTTAIELADQGGFSSSREAIRPVGPNKRRTSPHDDDDDAVLQASRAADMSAPDGGYGWVVVGAGAVLLWWSVGTTYSWGVIQAALVREGLAGPAVLSFVGSLMAALVSVFAILNARLIRSIGVRATSMSGVCIMGGGAVLSSFATKNVGALFFTSGVLMGIGASLCFVVISTVPAQYFSGKRGLANGLIFAGSGFGGAVISFGLDVLIQKLGLQWAYRILGCLMLVTGLPAAWLIKERIPLSTRSFIEWRLFKSLTFDLIFAAGVIGTFPLFVPPFFVPLYTNALGLSSSTGAGLVAGFALASAVGRIFSGVACDKLGPLNVLAASLTLTAVSMLAIWPTSTTLGPLVVFVLINGASNGGFFSTMPTVASNVFGSARVSVTMSMIITGWVGGYLMGAPIAGYLLQAYGGDEAGLKAYRPAMFYAGSLALASALMVLAARLRIDRTILAKL